MVQLVCKLTKSQLARAVLLEIQNKLNQKAPFLDNLLLTVLY
jgi:hypothetical protein